MKSFKLFLLLLLLTMSPACTTVLKDPWVNDYIGKSGFFTGGIQLTLDGKGGKYDVIKKCEPVQIKKLEKGLYLLVTISQAGKDYKIVLDMNNNNPQSYLQKYFKEKLDFKDEKLSFGDKTSTSRKKIVCEGRFFVGMTKDEFVFVKGFPRKINETVSGGYRSEQWIYGDFGPYFYFQDNKLMSWQISR